MNFELHFPSPAMASWVKHYWCLEGNSSNSEKERIFPDGCMELIFHYGDPFRKFIHESSHIQKRSFLHGQIKNHIELASTGSVGIFSVRFHPQGLQPFVRFNIRDLAENEVELKDLWGNDGVDLEDQILHASSTTERIKIIESFLSSKFNFPGTFSHAGECVNLINRAGGAISIGKLAETLNIGKRQLERRFIHEVGISPKLLARIIRFQNTLRLLEEKKYSRLTMLAYEGGFYDQAHFIRDFKDFTGLSPTEFYAGNQEMSKFIAKEFL